MKNKDYDDTILLTDDLREIIKTVLINNLDYPFSRDTKVIDSLNNDQFLDLCREINKALNDQDNKVLNVLNESLLS